MSAHHHPQLAPTPSLRPARAVCAPVGVIDIGSNSIKVLIAQRNAAGAVEAQFVRSLDVRIGANAAQPTELQNQESATHAIAALLGDCARYGVAPGRIQLVGTSALRCASDAARFVARVHERCEHPIRILSGEEEARAIGRGLLCDPELDAAQPHYAFDLGGGSLECLKLHEGKVCAALSLPLGSVRLMAHWVADPAAPLTATESSAIRAHVAQVFGDSGFALDLPPSARLIGAGGLWFNVRSYLAATQSPCTARTPALAPAWIPRASIEQLFSSAAGRPLAERRALPGISPGRADILPIALTTVLTLIELGGWSGLQHSAYNLRYGIAAELLDDA